MASAQVCTSASTFSGWIFGWCADVFTHIWEHPFASSSSATPEVLVTSTGTLHAMASMATKPNGSTRDGMITVSYTHLRAHETPEHLVCRLLLEKKKKKIVSQ
eukprot:TRINITY_DN16700_c0_g1_i2.p2 TRINITY_DN16700_c0_g1~~TRINITY_DN16700_c0_g1_i2.p2  ORF type:complete len:103 (-),score=20.31 TRINITY_DN16700_c0_g1_i2:71-379(-)